MPQAAPTKHKSGTFGLINAMNDFCEPGLVKPMTKFFLRQALVRKSRSDSP